MIEYFYYDPLLKGNDQMTNKHPGFKSVKNSISKKQGVSKQRAGAILASTTRKASSGAKKGNPRLNMVKG